MTSFPPPIFNPKYCIIVNNKDYDLAAVITSYLTEQGTYLPLFAFPEVEVYAHQEIENRYSYESRSKSESEELGIWIRNVLTILKDCETLILGGLSEHQKSFINVNDKINCIEIESISEIYHLKPFCSKTDFLECKIEDVYSGLFAASKSNQYLIINEHAESINGFDQTNEKGIVVIEDLQNVSTIMAINYAYSIDALPAIIKRPRLTMKEVNECISEWRETQNIIFLNDLRSACYPSLEHIHFENFEFATFFTLGIPYSLIIENIIPCTHVNLILKPDFFVFHSIFAEKRSPTWGAVVFSPGEFKDEETQDVIDVLNSNFYHVKEALGHSASCANLDFHIKEFPFDLFHICAHGGEVMGTPMSAKIIDETGAIHIFEYDFVLSLAPYPGIDTIGVTTLYFPKKLDGLNWKSEELRDMGFTNEFYESIFKQLDTRKDEQVGDQIKVHNSFGVNCHDFVYTGQFNIIAGFNSFPIIYNNTCWSWSEISHSFLNSGARIYIGNLWDIENKTAISISTKFYKSIFDMTLLEAFYSSIQEFKGTHDYNIGILWGLHFSTLKKAQTASSSKSKVVSKLCQSYINWSEHKKYVSDPTSIDQITSSMQWIKDQITIHYQKEYLDLKKQFKK